MKALQLSEAADRLSVSVDTLRRQIAAGRIHAVNLSLGSKRKKLVVPESEIVRVLTPPAPQPKRGRRFTASTRPRRY